jgi:hypothetical protein
MKYLKLYEDYTPTIDSYIYPVPVLKAIMNTVGAILYENGNIKLEVSRYQKPEQDGDWSVRTGVFYIPELKSPNYSTFYKNHRSYGGSHRITGQITLKKPYIVKAGMGGNGPIRAYEELCGRKEFKQLESDILQVIRYSSLKDAAEIQELLDKYGSDGDTADFILQNSRQGNQLRYSIQENIIAHAVRDKGYDSILCYGKSKGDFRLLELFYLEQDTYPDESGFVID